MLMGGLAFGIGYLSFELDTLPIGGKGTVNTFKPVNNMKIKTNEALDAASDWLGKGYKDMGRGRYVSADGTRQVRMTDSDIVKQGNHAGASDMNFETGKTVVKPNGKESFIPNTNGNYHIYIED